MFGECDVAEPGLCGPEFDFAVIATCDDSAAVGRVREVVEVEVVSLLFEDIGFGLPFPDEELAELRRTKS